MAEVIKWTLSGFLLAMGVSLNYLYAEQIPYHWRICAIVVAVAGAVVLAFWTNLGQQLLGFVHSSRTELKKVVWPTRQETVQVSIIVVIMVMVMSLILWGFDMALFKLMAWFTGQGV